MDLSAKTFVQAVSPSSARAILKKMKALKVANNDTSNIFDLDELDTRLTTFDFNDEDKDSGENSGKDKETLEAEVDASNSIGCYNFSYFVLFTYDFSLFLEVSHGAAALTHFSLTHITATLLTHSTAIVLTHSIALLIALPHWCSIYSGQSCRLFLS